MGSDDEPGYARKCLTGHNQAVQDVVTSSDGQFALSASWDKSMRLWDLNVGTSVRSFVGHTGPVHASTISPDGSLCASGGKDGTAMLWDVNDGKHLYSLDASSPINALTFSPKNYWLCAATDVSIKIWDLENKSVQDEIFPTQKNKNGLPWIVSMTWSADGNMLYCGSTNGDIFVYETAA